MKSVGLGFLTSAILTMRGLPVSLTKPDLFEILTKCGLFYILNNLGLFPILTRLGLFTIQIIVLFVPVTFGGLFDILTILPPFLLALLCLSTFQDLALTDFSIIFA